MDEEEDFIVPDSDHIPSPLDPPTDEGIRQRRGARGRGASAAAAAASGEDQDAKNNGSASSGDNNAPPSVEKEDLPGEDAVPNEDEMGEGDGEGKEKKTVEVDPEEAFRWWEKGLYQLYVKISTRNPQTGKTDFKWWERTEPIDAVDRDEFLRFSEEVMMDFLLGLAIDTYLFYASYIRVAHCTLLPDSPTPFIALLSSFTNIPATNPFASYTMYKYLISPLLWIIRLPLSWIGYLLIPTDTHPLAIVGLCPTYPNGSSGTGLGDSFLKFCLTIQLFYYFLHLLGRLWPDKILGKMEQFATCHLLYIVNAAVFFPLWILPSKRNVEVGVAKAFVASLNATTVKSGSYVGDVKDVILGMLDSEHHTGRLLARQVVSLAAVTLATTFVPKSSGAATVMEVWNVPSHTPSLPVPGDKDSVLLAHLERAPIVPSCENKTQTLFHHPIHPNLLSLSASSSSSSKTPAQNAWSLSVMSKTPSKQLSRTLRGKGFWGSWILGGPRWGPVLCWWIFAACHRIRWGILHWELQQKVAIRSEQEKGLTGPPEEDEEGNIFTGGWRGIFWRIGQIASAALVVLGWWWIANGFGGGAAVAWPSTVDSKGHVDPWEFVMNKTTELFPCAYNVTSAWDDAPSSDFVLASKLFMKTPDVALKGPGFLWVWLGLLVPSFALTVWINFMSFQHRAVIWGPGVGALGGVVDESGKGWHRDRGIVVGETEGEIKIGIIH
ncbi:hypothetical protein HDU97_005609 [Phlyctochytrium planicorne]|nr:hypothetical protein HDU97_005609 [Phlyctochytrium planicorne]